MSAFKRRAPAPPKNAQPPSAEATGGSSSSSSAPAPSKPPGTRVSAYNASLLLSTGLASLDDILGGGLPLGSLSLIHQDLVSTYTRLVLKFAVAQGVVSGQECWVWADEAELDSEFRKQLPGLDQPISASQSTAKEKEKERQGDGEMKIAFNYAGLGKFQRSVESQPEPPGSGQSEYCSTFDLTQHLKLSRDQQDRLRSFPLEPDVSPQQLFAHIQGKVQQRPANAPPLRIIIHSLADSLSADSWTPNATYRFLHSLRCLLRSTGSTALISIPAHLHQSTSINKWHHAADAVLNFQSFAAHPDLAAQFPRYNGLVHVLRLPTTSSMLPPSTKLSVLRGLATHGSGGGGAGGMDNNLAFRVKRRRFAIETLHLDVGGGSNERQVPDSDKNKAKEDAVKLEPQQKHANAPKKTFGPASKTPSAKSAAAGGQDW